MSNASDVLVKMQRDLAVGVRAKPVAARFEFTTDALEVVELSVDDEVKPPVLAGDGLVAARQINDAQASVAETDPLVGRHPLPLIVRPAMMQGGRGPAQGLGGDGFMTREEGGNTTHEINEFEVGRSSHSHVGLAPVFKVIKTALEMLQPAPEQPGGEELRDYTGQEERKVDGVFVVKNILG